MADVAVIVDIGQHIETGRPESVKERDLDEIDGLLPRPIELAMELGQYARAQIIDELRAVLEVRTDQRQVPSKRQLVQAFLEAR